MEEYKFYDSKIQEFCNLHGYGKDHYVILSLWLKDLFEHYKVENNFLNFDKNENYIASRLSLLFKLEEIKLYTIEDILNNSDNYFYQKIEERTGILKETLMTYTFRKENQKYFLDFSTDALYGLRVTGMYKMYQNSIEMIKATSVSSITFAHELAHSDHKFWYNSKFPFSLEIKTMMQEGDAIYHENLSTGNMFPKDICWNEETIQISTYPLYYQLYVLFSLVLPKETWEFWKKKYFTVQYLSSEDKYFIADLLAIITVILAKTKTENTDSLILESSNISVKDCQSLMELNEDEIEDLEFGIAVAQKIKSYVLAKKEIAELFLTLVKKVENFILTKGINQEIIHEFISVIIQANSDEKIDKR